MNENEENEETDAAPENADAENADGTAAGANGLENPLSKTTDRASRPGFRSKKNTGSNAMKKNKRKKKR